MSGNPIDFAISLKDDDVYRNSVIQYGVGVFDNIFQSLFTVFQMISMDSWTLIMFNLMDGGQTWMAIIYSHIIIVFGSFFLLNLILAVIMQAFMNIYTDSVTSPTEEEE